MEQVTTRAAFEVWAKDENGASQKIATFESGEAAAAYAEELRRQGKEPYVRG